MGGGGLYDSYTGFGVGVGGGGLYGAYVGRGVGFELEYISL